VGIAFALCLLIPIIMGFKGWDEHDRSNRYTAVSFASNYLNSCAENAIIFTQGDNDTYPLWYAQEVENIRPDVHVVNLSLLGVDWYINQKRNKVNEALPVPMGLSPEAIHGSNRDMVVFNKNTKIAPEGNHINLQKIMQFIGDDKNQRTTASGNDKMSFYPTKTFSLPVDKQKVLANGTVAPEDAALIVDKLEWEMKKGTLLKNDLLVLDIIAANDWERPIYFAVSVDDKSYMGLEKYFQLEGLAYRLVPIENKQKNRNSPFYGRVNTNIMADNLLNKFVFGNMKEGGMFLSTDITRMASNFRSNYMHLAEALLEEGKNEKAIEVMDKCIEEIPNHNNAFNLYSYRMPLIYYQAGANEKANQVADILVGNLIQEINYYENMKKPYFRKAFKGNTEQYKQVVGIIIEAANRAGEKEFSAELSKKLQSVL